MRTLKGQNVARDDSNPSKYPYGRLLDSSPPSAKNGTPIEEKVSAMGDVTQGMYRLLDRAGISPNETPEDATSSQINDSMDKLYIKKTMVSVIGGLVKSISGAPLSLTVTADVWLDLQKTRTFNLNITELGNYLVTACLATVPTSLNPYHLVNIGVKHKTADGWFDDNAANIFISVGGNDTSGVVEGDLPDSFILEIYHFS